MLGYFGPFSAKIMAFFWLSLHGHFAWEKSGVWDWEEERRLGRKVPSATTGRENHQLMLAISQQLIHAGYYRPGLREVAKCFAIWNR